MWQSPLRYPGGKQKALKNITSYIPDDIEEYREPFFGGGAVFFHIVNQNPHAQCWVNDLNHDLFCFWEQVQTNLECLVDEVKRIKQENFNGKNLFATLSQASPNTNLERAVRYFVLNRICFSGAVFCSGYSESAFQKRFTDSCIQKLAGLQGCFINTKITNDDYSNVVNASSSKKLWIYLDPPYLSQKNSKLYGVKGDLHLKFDHEQFAKTMQECSHRWLITYDDCETVRRNFAFAHIHEWQCQYGMNNYKQNKANKGKELIITNYG